MRKLTSEEEKERKKNRDIVAEADLQIEVDWRQRSRQLWLSAGDANTRFFQMAASGRRRQNCIQRMLVGRPDPHRPIINWSSSGGLISGVLLSWASKQMALDRKWGDHIVARSAARIDISCYGRRSNSGHSRAE